jgi:peptidoglycan-associated lipoprotein
MKRNRLTRLAIALVLGLFAAGCKKKVPPPPPPPPPPEEKPAPPPPPAAPVIQEFVAEPSSIERGGSSTLRWRTQNADAVTIDQGVGTVQASGSRQVFPSNTTTYRLTAKGAGGSVDRTVTVNVTVPPPPPPKPKPVTRSFEERLSAEVQDAFFDFDKSDIRPDARQTLTRNADALKSIFQAFPDRKVVIEGHCDERGSAEYNLALGDRRATSAREFLLQLGVPGDKLTIISYGEERPQCFESNEDCWQRNRRAHFAPAR